MPLVHSARIEITWNGDDRYVMPVGGDATCWGRVSATRATIMARAPTAKISARGAGGQHTNGFFQIWRYFDLYLPSPYHQRQFRQPRRKTPFKMPREVADIKQVRKLWNVWMPPSFPLTIAWLSSSRSAGGRMPPVSWSGSKGMETTRAVH